MEIHFCSRKMQKMCNSEKQMRAKLGSRIADRLMQRLAELVAAESLDDIPRVPPVRCHELSHNRKGQLAVDLVHPKRLVFRPHHDPVPTRDDGGLDWKRVTKILILEIVDYH